MHPILIEFRGAGLQSYILLFSLAFFVGMGVWIFENRHTGIAADTIINLSLQTFAVGLVGARVLYLLTRWEDVISGELRFWQIWEGGVVFLGGAIAGAGFLFWRARKYSMSWTLAFNTAAPALAFAHAMGRLGCFLNGCCFGSACPYPWGLSYSNPISPARPLNTPLHPTQLYEVFGLILLGTGLHLWNRRKRSGWQSYELYLLGYGILRFGVEFFRGDEIRGFWGPLSTSQWLSLVMVSGAFALHFRKDLSKA